MCTDVSDNSVSLLLCLSDAENKSEAFKRVSEWQQNQHSRRAGGGQQQVEQERRLTQTSEKEDISRNSFERRFLLRFNKLIAAC